MTIEHWGVSEKNTFSILKQHMIFVQGPSTIGVLENYGVEKEETRSGSQIKILRMSSKMFS